MPLTMLCMVAGVQAASTAVPFDVAIHDDPTTTVVVASVAGAMTAARRRAAAAKTSPARPQPMRRRVVSRYRTPRMLSWWTPAVWRGPPVPAC